MQALRNVRRGLKRRLTNVIRALDTPESQTSAKAERLNEIWEAMKTLHNQMLSQASEEEIEEIMEDFEQEEERMFDAKEKLAETRSIAESSTSVQSTSAEVRLPPLNLPVFAGDVTEWTTFSDLFKAAVHENSTLADAQRLQYLKGSLRGEAANLLRHIPITGANYIEAWELLKNRYENKRHTANVIIQRILALPSSRDKCISLREVLDKIYEAERALRPLVAEELRWGLLITNIILNSVDKDTVESWELSLSHTEIPPLQELLNFLEIRARAIGNKPFATRETHPAVPNNIQLRREKNLSNKKDRCSLCKEEHRLSKCGRFLKLTTEKRRQLTQEKELCFNCLSYGHTTINCNSNFRCRTCKKSHHSLLHLEDREEPKNILTTCSEDREVLLPTAEVELHHNDKRYKLRALLDSGSQINLISTKIQRKLNLKTRLASKVANTISGQCPLSAEITITIGKGEWTQQIRCFVSEDFNIILPSRQLSDHQGEHINGLQLADPEFYTPRQIDLLLGINVCSQIMMDGLRKGEKHQPIAQNTRLGWTVCGSITESSEDSVSHIHESLNKFWELEELPETKISSTEDALAEEHFTKTTRRLSTGAYEVSYPFKEHAPSVGASKAQAIRRFLQLEKRLDRTNKKQDYRRVIQEYLDLGHMVPVLEHEKNFPAFYLPHHAVYKDSLTTKLRVVFDASAMSTDGNSLNDTMLNGPKIQDDLFHILLRFRFRAIAVSADIEKMYRQIQINQNHQHYQRVIWRDTPQDNLKEYKLTTVTFGVRAAPFLAIRTLQQLAIDEGNKYPLASSVLRQDFYVDDLLTGANTAEDAITLCKELDGLLTAGGFKLRKWCSNDRSVLKELKNISEVPEVPITVEDTTTLGLKWNPIKDIFTVKVELPSRKRHTKRTLLSDTARIFDPLGWFAPTTIKAKIMFQDLWRLKMQWDQELPQELLIAWEKFRDDLQCLQEMEIPRQATLVKPFKAMLCGFCDASEKAYGAVIYIRSEKDGHIKTQLLVAKSKVAPLKKITIPRLELCGAVLLSRLLAETRRALKKDIPAICYTDSTVVLHWISKHPSNWKPFVGHRVAKIKEKSPACEWFHVSTNENPADAISRGIYANDLKKSAVWWNGPDWLKEQELPRTTVRLSGNPPDMRKPKSKILTHTTINQSFVEKFSSLDKLLRITVWIKRFIGKLKKMDVLSGPVQTVELNEARKTLVKMAQAEQYNKEIRYLRTKHPLSQKSKILALTPFIDDEGILRVGGRLENAPIPFNQRHQILLPIGHHLTNLILEDIHKKNLHAGPQLMLATLRQGYWLPSAKGAIRKIVYNCIACTRHRAIPGNQMMGHLPSQRVTPSRPFLNCGVDYCGPLNCRQMVGRTRKSHKAYVAVFVCMATKAVHLEPVSSLTMESLLAALTRFISRRGLPTDMFSDNGRNFVAARSHLRDLYKMLSEEDNQEIIHRAMSSKGIQWHFNPPYSPHFGGLWEAAVKSFKFHLRRIAGKETLTFEELATVLCKIEACLNSRPLCPLSEDKSDLEALTPGHFLIGQPINLIPEPNSHNFQNLRSRYQIIKKITSDFWKRWLKEYLSTLQAKTKWKIKRQPFKEGDLVLLKDPTSPIQLWKLGRILETSKDTTQQTRVLTIKTSTGVTTRAATQVIKLFPEDESKDSN